MARTTRVPPHDPAADSRAHMPETTPDGPAQGEDATAETANKGDPADQPVSQLTPTSTPTRNAYGLELDRFGLPVNGPARSAVLARMAVADPAIEPGDWDFRGADKAASVMEKIYG